MKIHPRIQEFLPFLLVSGAVVLAFSGTLHGGWFMDDHYFIKEIHGSGGLERTGRDLAGNWLGFTGYAYYRPLVTASFALDHALFGLRPWGYHLTNLLLHLANAWLVLVLVRRIYPAGGRLGALAAALLFATHPVHPNAVGWVAARSDLLVGFGTLGMLVAYHVAWSRGRRTPLVVGVILFGLALLAKESGVVAVLLAGVLPGPAGVKRRLKTLMPALGLLVGYALIRQVVLETGLNLHEVASPLAAFTGSSLQRVVQQSVHAFGEQLVQVLNPTQTANPWLAFWPVILLGPAAVSLVRRGGLRTAIFGAAVMVFSLLPVLPILPNLEPAFFWAYSRYWYLAVVGLAVVAALSVGGAGRLRAAAFLAIVVLAGLNAYTSRTLFERYLGKPAEMVAAVARLVDRAGGKTDPDRITVFLRSADDRYAGQHVNALAFAAAAVWPFTSRDVPLFPLTVQELQEVVRVHGGHRGILVVTLDPGTGRPAVVVRLPELPRWREATMDGPYRLAVGLCKDVGGSDRSPLSFDVLRLEGVKGTGRLSIKLETDLGVFEQDRLADGTGQDLAYYFRGNDELLRARAVSWIRIEPLDRQENPLKGVVEVARVVVEDLETVCYLEVPGPGADVAVWPRPPALRWRSNTPRELGIRFLTVFGIHPPLPKHPLRPRDGVPTALQKKLVVGTHLGCGWFVILARPPAPATPGQPPSLRVPPVALRARRP